MVECDLCLEFKAAAPRNAPSKSSPKTKRTHRPMQQVAKAVMLGVQSIAMGLQQCVVAGGMESMSNAPFLLPRIRSTKVTGDLVMKDSMVVDGLQDAYKETSMGICAELCAEEMGISRYEQDSHAIQSYERALAAQATGLFNSEITPLTIVGKKVQDSKIIALDEECSKFNPEKLRSLPSAFLSNGTITAGNSSTIGDGSAVLLLASAEFAEKKGLPILARVRGFGDAAQAPEKFPTSPALAIPKALQHAGLEMKRVELFEINEAFSVVDLANRKLLGLLPDQVNIHGGAVSLGHPIGASGARIIVSLITNLALHRKRIGVASICNGGGGASAIVIERDLTYHL
ncbi:hypothetical protein O6H91_21G009900 [Diphasiastrum complanatum]|uniref:Uncharacterized protein n=1 Tax=Diphasiastrum complanatum TaxID=34168 RepID=A0ACC2AHZ5_DIPCM|nr:hypothetical protein O6H91_21G009900 [Diphasiastrum complanatum]